MTYYDKLKVLHDICTAYLKCDYPYGHRGIICPRSNVTLVHYNQIIMWIPGYVITVVKLPTTGKINCYIEPQPKSTIEREKVLKYMIGCTDEITLELENGLCIWSKREEFRGAVSSINKLSICVQH